MLTIDPINIGTTEVHPDEKVIGAVTQAINSECYQASFSAVQGQTRIFAHFSEGGISVMRQKGQTWSSLVKKASADKATAAIMTALRVDEVVQINYYFIPPQPSHFAVAHQQEQAVALKGVQLICNLVKLHTVSTKGAQASEKDLSLAQTTLDILAALLTVPDTYPLIAAIATISLITTLKVEVTQDTLRQVIGAVRGEGPLTSFVVIEQSGTSTRLDRRDGHYVITTKQGQKSVASSEEVVESLSGMGIADVKYHFIIPKGPEEFNFFRLIKNIRQLEAFLSFVGLAHAAARGISGTFIDYIRLLIEAQGREEFLVRRENSCKKTLEALMPDGPVLLHVLDSKIDKGILKLILEIIQPADPSGTCPKVYLSFQQEDEYWIIYTDKEGKIVCLSSSGFEISFNTISEALPNVSDILSSDENPIISFYCNSLGPVGPVQLVQPLEIPSQPLSAIQALEWIRTFYLRRDFVGHLSEGIRALFTLHPGFTTAYARLDFLLPDEVVRNEAVERIIFLTALHETVLNELLSSIEQKDQTTVKALLELCGKIPVIYPDGLPRQYRTALTVYDMIHLSLGEVPIYGHPLKIALEHTRKRLVVRMEREIATGLISSSASAKQKPQNRIEEPDSSYEFV
jgi:hypothetical protein